MPVTVRRGAKAQPVSRVRKLSNVGAVMTQDSGCSRSRNDGTRDTGASLLNALVSQPRIVREASLVLEPRFHWPEKCESRTKIERFNASARLLPQSKTRNPKSRIHQCLPT